MVQQQAPSEIDLLRHNPQFQEALQIAAKHWTYSAIMHANMLAHLLIAKKQLPSFYFIEAAAEIGIPPQSCRYLKLNTWPISPQRNQERLRDIVQILTNVHLRVLHYPETETYPEAMQRLRKRVEHLIVTGITHNRVAQHLRVSYKTLKDILDNPDNVTHRPRHCPWAMLNRLKHAEDEIDTATHYRLGSEPSARYRANQISNELPPPDDSILVPMGSPCYKCSASPVHLYPDGKDAWGNIIRTCRICSTNNVSPPQNLRTDDIIERYAPCWSCGGPWHNLGKNGIDQEGYTIYICVLCSEKNRLPPKNHPPTRVTQYSSHSRN